MPEPTLLFAPSTPLRFHAPSSSIARHLRRPTPSCSASSADRKAVRRSLSEVQVPPFARELRERVPHLHPLTRQSPETLQINIGLTCNLACRHCHVESSPVRSETMSHHTAERLVELASATVSSPVSTLRTVDITGGAPEMHAEFRFLVESFSALGLTVIDRCNLTVLHRPELRDDLIPFLVSHRVRIVASMPCYSPANVEKQRGDGVFDASISALQLLNAAGYGRPDSGLQLDLVYNPGGPSLPPPQQALEQDYKRELERAFGITFSNLICITNMPIKRFADDLFRTDTLHDYMQTLLTSFNPDTVQNVMCRNMVHVAHDGSLYDCDFNYALEMGLPLSDPSKREPIQGIVQLPDRLTVFDIDDLSDMTDRVISTAKHCYGCTAGSGSSCGGSLA